MDSVKTAWLVLGLSALAFASSSAGMSLGAEPFATWYFCFAWWPYILGLESWLHVMGGYSPLYERPGRFWVLPPLSVVFWVIFEILNFRLGNWHYVGLPASLAARWAGYALGFATVLPALSATARFLEFMGMFENRGVSRVSPGTRWRLPSVLAGAAMLGAAMSAPEYCFALVWVAFIFILEPLVHALGGRSIVKAWERGSLRRAGLWMMAGLVCGLLWECWNYWSGAKWSYTVPFAGPWRLFEMPLPGYLGFPPFALECLLAVEALRSVQAGLRPRGAVVRLAAAVLCVAGGLVLAWAAFTGIDAFTVAELAR